MYVGAKTFQDVFVESGRVHLRGGEDFVLSIRPLLMAINSDSQFVILDKLNVRNIYLFSADGSLIDQIGTEGNLPGQYVYPHTLTYSRTNGSYYVYDGDLLQVLEYGEDFQFRDSFPLALYIDQLLMTPEGRLFSYSSGKPTAQPPKTVVYEIGDGGRLVNTFAPQSNHYSDWSASEGGGIAYARGRLYVITPYEYEIAAYSLSGRRLMRVSGSSPHYVPPAPQPEAPAGADVFEILRHYHERWSHIRQLFVLNDKMIGVVFAEPGEEGVYLDLYELNLSPIAQDLILPNHAGEVFPYGDSLYMIDRESIGDEVLPLQTVVAQYRLIQPSDEASIPEELSQ